VRLSSLAAMATDTKGELNQFLQKHCKRPITKTDVIYTTTQYGMQYQSIVKVNCIGGQEYAGMLAADKKAAEKSAAEQALAGNAVAVQAVKAAGATPAAKGKKRPAPQVLTPEEKAAKQAKIAEEKAAKQAKIESGEIQKQPIPAKTELNTLLMRIAKRTLQKSENIYTCNKIDTQFQATIQITCLPDEWKDKAWAGELCATKQEAEQSAAEQAVIFIKGDETLATMAMPRGKGAKGQMLEMLNAYMESWGWKWGDEEIPKQMVSEEDYIGTVLEWHGHYGWLKTEQPIDHEAKEFRDGKIYVNKKELADGTEELVVGGAVKFKLHVNPAGLGAEQVTPL